MCIKMTIELVRDSFAETRDKKAVYWAIQTLDDQELFVGYRNGTFWARLGENRIIENEKVAPYEAEPISWEDAESLLMYHGYALVFDDEL